MTVSTVAVRIPYAGNGVAVEFAGPKVYDADHISVLVDGVALDPASDFSVAGAGLAESTVTFAVAPADGTSVEIVRTVPLLQQTKFKNQGAFFPELHEEALDRTVMMIQQVEERSLRLPIAIGSLDPELPAPVAGGVPMVNDAGTGFSWALWGTNPEALASLSMPGGSALIGHADTLAPAYLQTVSDILNGLPVSLHRFIDPTKLSAIRAMTSDHDCSSALTEAAGAARSIYVPRGLHLYSGNIGILDDAQFSLRGEGSGHSILRCMGAGGLVYSNSNNHNFGMPRLDLKGLRLEAGIANAGNAITMTGTGGSGYAGVGSRFEDVEIVPSAAGTYWTKGIRGTNVRNARFSRVVVGSNAITAETTHGFHFDGDSDPVELWFDGMCYLYVLTTGILVEGTYEGIYLHGINMTTVQDGLIYHPTSVQPVCHVQDSYINCRRVAVDLDLISYFKINDTSFSTTGIGTGSFYAAKINRSSGAQVSASDIANITVIGGNGYTGPDTENGVLVVSGNTIDVHNSKFYTLNTAVEFQAGAGLREYDNAYIACTTPVIKPASISATSQSCEVLLRADDNGAGQAVPAAATTVMAFARALNDNYSYFNATTYRWTPPAGTYRMQAAVRFTTGVLDGDEFDMSILKNGLVYRNVTTVAAKAGLCVPQIDATVEASGTDYFEIAVSIVGAAGDRTRVGSPVNNFLNAEVIR